MAKGLTKRLLLVNIFGAFGYMSCLLQWMWLSVLILPPLFENPDIRLFFTPAPGAEPRSVEPLLDESSIVLTIVAVAITALVLIVTLVILVRLPVSIARSGKKTVAKTAEAMIPIVTHHKKIPAAKKRRLGAQLSKYIKLVLCVLPVTLLGFLFVVPSELDSNISVIVGAVLGIGSLTWFTLEYTFAKWLKVPFEKII